MLSAFSGLITFAGEEVTVLRATPAAQIEEARHQPRGLERNVHGDAAFGSYKKRNTNRLKITATVSPQKAKRVKTESGEARVIMRTMQTLEPMRTTDESRGDYADLVELDGDTYKVTAVEQDKLGGIYVSSLTKLSDDHGVETGA